jgi:hypothetical protein
MRFIVDGFPRQGNTSLAQLLTNVFPTVDVGFIHYHDISKIIKELEEGSTVFSPVRNPVETLSSFLEMQRLRHPQNDNPVDRSFMIAHAMQLLKDFQEYFIKNINLIKIINFEDVINMSTDFSQGVIHKNRVINKISIDFNILIKPHNELGNLFSTISEYSSTKSSFFEAEILKEEFKEKLTLLIDNHSFLISKSY